MLNGLSSYCSNNNRVGVITVEYAPVHWIDKSAFRSILNTTGDLIAPVVFTKNDWLKAYVLPRRSWREGNQSHPVGSIYPQSIQLETPTLKPAVQLEFTNMANMRFIMKLKDKNKRTWLIGTPEHPLRFLAPSEITPSSNKYSLQFSGSTPSRAFGYPF